MCGCVGCAGLHPRWCFLCRFPLKVPALAVVRFAVMDHQDPPQKALLVASCVLRVQQVRAGLRTVPLCRPDGTRDLFARLFALVDIFDAQGVRADWDREGEGDLH